MTNKAPEDCIFMILAVVPCRKWSDYLCYHAYGYSNGSMAFVILAYHWVTNY